LVLNRPRRFWSIWKIHLPHSCFHHLSSQLPSFRICG
jgi:hypothetical protein